MSTKNLFPRASCFVKTGKWHESHFTLKMLCSVDSLNSLDMFVSYPDVAVSNTRSFSLLGFCKGSKIRIS